jgi:hypothetical protein
MKSIVLYNNFLIIPNILYIENSSAVLQIICVYRYYSIYKNFHIDINLKLNKLKLINVKVKI